VDGMLDVGDWLLIVLELELEELMTPESGGFRLYP